MNVTDGASTSQVSGGAAQTFYPSMSTVCANNGALSMSPPSYTQLVAMAPAPLDTLPRGYHDGHLGTMPRDFQYRSDSSCISGPSFPQLPNTAERTVLGDSMYQTSPRWHNSGIQHQRPVLMNGVSGPPRLMNGYSTCGSANRFVSASIIENGRVFNEAGEDDNSMELQHLLCANSKNNIDTVPTISIFLLMY